MKCPICGETLTPSKKDPDYLLCYTCKKKFKVPAKAKAEDDDLEEQEKAPKKAPKKKTAEPAKSANKKFKEQKYSNIPPKDVRDKREREMKKAYDDMLSVEEDEKVSKAPIVILAIAIIIVAAAIAYMLFFR